MKFKLFALFAIFLSATSIAQNPAIDVQKYDFSIELTDENDNINGKAEIAYELKQDTDELVFDLVGLNEEGKGMQVDSILSSGKKLKFEQKNEKLKIVTPDSSEVTIYYHGIPQDGLIISRNKYGDRTFFGDNWPNRAHHWLPVIDHPSDKAYVDFTVTAPSHYQVVANGSLLETTNLDEKVLYRYSSSVPLPTKVMVIGVAEFAVEHLEEINDVPVSSWVYPENKKEGFYDYAQAKEVLQFFMEKVGPYPYTKLANVQSTTRYGGMENASNIFYFENSVTGERTSEFLISHEIAHQWFGDSASESDWSHLWLSEGFATYFTDLYAENKYGKKKLDEKLQEERTEVLNFSKKEKTPVIDTTRSDYTELLNPNSYQKGAWFLHMLRRKVGDDNFWEAIRKYYEKYKLSNATTDDLQAVFEEVSGKELGAFFNQWLRQYGHPVLSTDWEYKNGKIFFEVVQSQKNNFSFPLEIKISYTDGSSEMKTLEVIKKKQKFEIDSAKKPARIELDPETNLLFEEK